MAHNNKDNMKSLRLLLGSVRCTISLIHRPVYGRLSNMNRTVLSFHKFVHILLNKSAIILYWLHMDTSHNNKNNK